MVKSLVFPLPAGLGRRDVSLKGLDLECFAAVLSKIFTQCPLEQIAKPSAITLIFLSSPSEQ